MAVRHMEFSALTKLQTDPCHVYGFWMLRGYANGIIKQRNCRYRAKFQKKVHGHSLRILCLLLMKDSQYGRRYIERLMDITLLEDSCF